MSEETWLGVLIVFGVLGAFAVALGRIAAQADERVQAMEADENDDIDWDVKRRSA